MSDLTFCKLVLRKSFQAENPKKAYMDACKWYATNIIAKGYDLKVEYKKKFNEVTLLLYVSLDEKEVKEKHCEICKSMHNQFFLNDKQDCNACKMLAFNKRMEQLIDTKVQCIKSKLWREI